MAIPLRITVRQFESTEAIEQEVRERVAQLERIYDRITSAHVILEAPVRHHRKGGPFAVKIDVSVPGSEIVVSDRSDDDLYAAIHGAFDAARRRLDAHAERLRQEVKAHSRA